MHKATLAIIHKLAENTITKLFSINLKKSLIPKATASLKFKINFEVQEFLFLKSHTIKHTIHKKTFFFIRYFLLNSVFSKELLLAVVQ